MPSERLDCMNCVRPRHALAIDGEREVGSRQARIEGWIKATTRALGARRVPDGLRPTLTLLGIVSGELSHHQLRSLEKGGQLAIGSPRRGQPESKLARPIHQCVAWKPELLAANCEKQCRLESTRSCRSWSSPGRCCSLVQAQGVLEATVAPVTHQRVRASDIGSEVRQRSPRSAARREERPNDKQARRIRNQELRIKNQESEFRIRRDYPSISCLMPYCSSFL